LLWVNNGLNPYSYLTLYIRFGDPREAHRLTDNVDTMLLRLTKINSPMDDFPLQRPDIYRLRRVTCRLLFPFYRSGNYEAVTDDPTASRPMSYTRSYHPVVNTLIIDALDVDGVLACLHDHFYSPTSSRFFKKLIVFAAASAVCGFFSHTSMRFRSSAAIFLDSIK